MFLLCGLAGSVIVLAAYFANQVGRLASDDWRFPFANLAGSVLILASFYNAMNWPSLFIEVFWIAISLFGLVRIYRRTA